MIYEQVMAPHRARWAEAGRLERQPWASVPAESGAEAALLGAVLKHPELLARLTVRPHQFWSHPCQRVLAAWIAGALADTDALIAAVPSARDLAAVDLAYDSRHWQAWERLILDAWQRRELIDAAQWIAEAAWEPRRPFSAPQAIAGLRRRETRTNPNRKAEQTRISDAVVEI